MQREYDGVHFYGRYDHSTAYMLEKAVPLLDKFDEAKSNRSINEITELYGIARALEAKSVLPTWDDETARQYQAIGKKIQAVIGRFAAHIGDQNMIQYIQELDGLYFPDFLDLIEHYGVYRRISGDTFSLILCETGWAMPRILWHEKLVTNFGQQITDYMTMHSESGAWLVEHYLLAKEYGERENVFFPKELSLAQREGILIRYVESEECNLNILRILQTSQGVEGLPVSDVLRLKAKRRYEEETEKHFAEHSGIEQITQVGFMRNMSQVKEVQFDHDGLAIQANYSIDWIEENQDYPTLLNNFIYLFEYTDSLLRSNFPALKSQAGFADILLQCRGVGDYSDNHAFHTMDSLSCLQIMGYCHNLKRYGIELENIFQWFFETYLPKEFGGIKIRYNAPTKDASMLEKIRMIAQELEGTLKQYDLYCKYGEIDLELLEVSTSPVIFSDLPSMQSKKYVYPASQECQNMLHFLFSPQSWLPNKEDSNGKWWPFGHAVLKGLVSSDDLKEMDIPIINEMQRKGIISIGDNGTISADLAKIAIYWQLYSKEVLCYQYCGELAPIIDDMASQGEVKFGATLFSEPEQHYMNFMLNNKEYSNGRSLRNKYAHSGYPQDPKQQEEDYYQLLKVTVLAIIKINEEFCLRFPEQENNEENEQE